MTSTLPPLIQAFSGSIGSATANTISYPLDLVATRLQSTHSRSSRGWKGIILTLRHIVHNEGWGGLYDGIATDTAATLVSNFLYFYFYSFLRRILVRRKSRLSPPGASKSRPVLFSATEELGIGFVAGVASRAISTPLSVLTVRLQTATEEESSDNEKEELSDCRQGSVEMTKNAIRKLRVIEVAKSVWEEEGWAGFWGGFTTTIPLSMNPALTLFLFQIWRRITTQGHGPTKAPPNSGSTSSFFGAAFSNTIATLILYPLILAKTRLQVHHRSTDGHRKLTVVDVWMRASQREGLWKGLYQGLEAQILKGFMSQGVAMLMKQRIEMMVIALYLRRMGQ